MHILEALAAAILASGAIAGVVVFIHGGMSMHLPHKLALSVLLVELLAGSVSLTLVGAYRCYTAAQTDDVAYFFTGVILFVAGLRASATTTHLLRKV